MKVKVGTRCFGHFNNIFKVTYIHNSFPSGIRLIKKQGLLKWWNEQNISARDSRAELSCEGRVGSTLACLGTSWRKSRVQYECKHSSEVVGGRMGGQWDTKVQQSSSQEHWLSAAMPQGCRALLGGGDRGRRELMRSRRRWRRSWSKRRRRWRRRRWEEEEGGCCSCIVGASPPPRSSPTPPHLHSNNFLFNSLPFLFPLIIWQQGFFGIKTPLSILNILVIIWKEMGTHWFFW